MKSSFALPLLAGITIGVITMGVIVLAHNDFFWYRNISMMGNETTENSVDATFIENMIPHHEGAIEMANLALAKAKTDEVKNLSESIIISQQKEIDDMKTWYKEWFGKDIETLSESTGMMGDGGMHMGGASMQGDIEELEAAENFDKEFVLQMIPHHEMAIMMAQMMLRTTARNEMKTLAQSIIDSQTMEVEQMRSWLTTWE
ncbi:MAG: DUF305 domain-containing protein [Patescibacteria group bacterium]